MFLSHVVVEASPDGLFGKGGDPLVIGVEDYYYPFSYEDDNGDRTGFDFDFSQALCRRLNKECIIKPYPFPELIPSLKQGSIDIIIAGMGMTEERLKMGVIFSEPYYHGQSIFVTMDHDLSYITEKNAPELVMGTQVDSMQLEKLHKRFPMAKAIVAYPTYDELFEDLLSGKTDVGYIDGLAGFEILKSVKAQDVHMIVDKETDVSDSINYARLVLRQQNKEELKLLNNVLEKLNSSSEYQNISLKYFPFIIN